MIVGDPRERARELIVFCDGADDAAIPCLHAFTARGRLVANDLLDLADQLDAERSARRTIQERHETFLERMLNSVPYAEAAGGR